MVKITNLIFELGIYPQSLKLSKIIPVYKDGDSKVLNNYRPISILNSTNKIIEKLLYTRIVNFLNDNDFFYKKQYGFRRLSNTSCACTEILIRILLEIDSGEIVTGLFLDLSKAFDTVNHDLLIDKLKNSGIRGIPLTLIRNYLTNRQQYVSLNGITSNRKFTTIGVPQGSVLGPLFFLIFINDIMNINLMGQLNIYADDCAIFYNNKNINDNVANINYDLKLLYDYFCKNKLTLNIQKSQYMNFHSQNKIIQETQIYFHGNNMETTYN